MQKLSARTNLKIRIPETRRLSRVNARVSTSKQDLDRQVDALQAVGIDPARIYLDKKSGSTVERPGLRAVTGYARDGDVIVVHTPWTGWAARSGTP